VGAVVIRILVAEDEQPLRDAICDLLGSEADMEVVASVGSAAEAIKLAARTTPDIALLDVRMPGGGALAARGIREKSPQTRVLALSAYEDQATVLEMLGAGAAGYLVKGISPAEVVEAVERAMRGQASISIDVIERVIDELASDMNDRHEANEGLRRSEKLFRGLLESAPDAVVILDDKGCFVFVNAQTEELFGYPRDELLGCRIEMLLPERVGDSDVEQPGDYLWDPKTRPLGVGLDLVGRRKDGSEFPVDVSLSTIETDEGSLVTAFIQDITERRDAEAATRELAAIVESSDDAIIGKALDGTILSWNRGAERMFGYSSSEVIGRSVNLLVPTGHDDDLPDILERLTQGEEIDQFETIRAHKEGPEIDVSLKVSAIRDGGGKIVGASTIARDITQLKAQVLLERDLAERRALVGHLVSAGEEERRRISADIHDDSIQAITAAGMRLQILRRGLTDPEQLRMLTELEDTIQLSIGRLRHLLFELRPPVLDNEGLSAAVEMYLIESAGETQTRFILEDRLRSQPPSDTRTILYRILQEALTNVRKHAHAENGTVVLHEQDGGFLVRVSDDGVGFLGNDTRPAPGHLGLAAVRERATLAGGWLRIDAAPNRGTTVEVWLPAGGEGGANGIEPADARALELT
jgi:PAS domain S-box-containing protein